MFLMLLVALSISATILGLLGIAGWMRDVGLECLKGLVAPVHDFQLELRALSAAIFGDINIHGPEAILVSVMLAIELFRSARANCNHPFLRHPFAQKSIAPIEIGSKHGSPLQPTAYFVQE